MRATIGKSFHFDLNWQLLFIRGALWYATIVCWCFVGGGGVDAAAVVSTMKPRFCGKALTDMLEFVCDNGFHAQRMPRRADSVTTLLQTFNERKDMPQLLADSAAMAMPATESVAMLIKAIQVAAEVKATPAEVTTMRTATTIAAVTNASPLINAKLNGNKNQNVNEIENHSKVEETKYQQQQQQQEQQQQHQHPPAHRRRRRLYGIVYECCKIGCFYNELRKYCQ